MNKNKSGTPARKLNSLSVEQKDEIIKYKKSHPHMTQAAIALYFEKEWNLQFKITKSTMSYIMTNTAKKIEKVDDIERLNKRIKEVFYPDLEKCLMMWYFQTIVILPIIYYIFAYYIFFKQE